MGARTFSASDKYIAADDAAAIEVHEQTASPFLAQSNLFFVFLFLFEMILKLLAYGPRQCQLERECVWPSIGLHPSVSQSVSQ